MWSYNYSDELYHYGIKGMKWGVRRFQNKNGILTNAGKKRYSDNSTGSVKKSKHRMNLENKYRQQGMSKKQAEEAAAKRIKTEKIIAATAAMTVAAATAYVVNKNIKERADGVIKAGTKMQVIGNNPNKSFDKAFYTAYNKSDKIKYKGMYGSQLKDDLDTKGIYKTTLNADKDVKIASRKKAADAFAELYKNDPEFRKGFEQNNAIMGNQLFMRPNVAKLHTQASKDMTDKQLRKVGYDAFNRGLVNHDPNANNIAKKFYDKLKQQGYDAVMDVNDQKYSGYKAKKPVIVFNKGDKISVSNVKEMTDEQITSNFKNARNRLMAPEIAKTVGVYGGSIAGGRAIANAANKVAIKKYRKEHPNTKMTDKEILKTLNPNIKI